MKKSKQTNYADFLFDFLIAFREMIKELAKSKL